MKSLDEVIKAYEVCHNRIMAKCSDCPYFGDECATDNMERDVLYYPKEYRVKQDELERTKKSCFAFVGSKMIEAEKQGQTFCCPNCGNEFILLPKENPVLTWDELRSMKEKPVWAEYYDPIDDKSGWKRGQWVLVDQFDDDEVEFFPMGADYPEYITKEQYKPDGWQAYRRERS